MMLTPDENRLGLAERSMYSPEFLQPTGRNYEQLQEGMLGLRFLPGVSTESGVGELRVNTQGNTLIDPELYGAGVEIGLLMVESNLVNGATKLDICYTETATHEAIRGTRLEHKYRLEQKGGKVINSWQSVEVIAPMLETPPSRDKATTTLEYLQAEGGMDLLSRYYGKRVFLSAGDCDVLHERMMLLKRA